ncbi:hypothetical protein L596_025064 [Steinernema carpocapsae]|uniref:E2 domain-containing protein n=1 Tax=Steinernema carpocapsae TaxID=34508 RepID=A0A4U5M6V4_STECR|nr:hypothetical protein L596_025064 [Steinernema carpocapsae]
MWKWFHVGWLIFATVGVWYIGMKVYWSPKMQPVFKAEDYGTNDSFSSLFQFDQLFQTYFENELHYRSLRITQPNLRYIVALHGERVEEALPHRKKLAHDRFQSAISSYPNTTDDLNRAILHYFQILCSERARELNMFIAFLAGDNTIMAEGLLKTGKHVEFVSHNLGQIEGEVKTALGNLSFDHVLKINAAVLWNELKTKYTPMLKPSCSYWSNITEFYLMYFKKVPESNNLNFCLRSRSNYTLELFLVFVIIVGGLALLAEHLYKSRYMKKENVYRVMENEMDPSRFKAV